MDLRRILKNPRSYILAFKRSLLNSYRSKFFKGKHVKCNLCGWNGKRFFSRRCPKCNSLPRIRLIPYSLEYFRLLKDDKKILHIAPNINEFNFIQSKIASGIQYDRLNIRKFDHINLVQNLTNTTIETNTYDLSIAWHVFEHIKEDEKAIKEVYRILKPGGKFLLSVPIYPKYNETTYEDSSIPYELYKHHHGHEDHCRSCGLDYYKRFEQVGFKTKTLVVDQLDQLQIDKFGLSLGHVVWCFIK